MAAPETVNTMANFDHLLSVQGTLNRSHARPERVKEKDTGKDTGGGGSIGSAELRAGKAPDEADDGPTGFDSDESVGGFGDDFDFLDDEDGGDEGT